ncbi:hypothetical protein, partial [Alistipes sp.]|uniref:hypothetical protein n=1 Tax=Alistipes sp. TaxID=1872444 RepID=UPI0025B9452C
PVLNFGIHARILADPGPANSAKTMPFSTIFENFRPKSLGRGDSFSTFAPDFACREACRV